MMKVFIDNDVVIKLAKYNLLGSFGDILEQYGHTPYLLDSLPYVCRIHQGTFEVLSNAEEHGCVSTFINSAQVATIKSLETINIIGQIDDPNLDAGELVLLGCVKESCDANFCSGDKRAIVAIDQHVKGGNIQLFDYSIATLEQAIKFMLACHCSTTVINKIKSKPNVDAALKACFREASVDRLENTFGALDSYINHIKSQCSALVFSELF